MHVTKEMQEKSRNVDLVSYLEARGLEVKHCGASYKLRIDRKYPGDLSSLSIFADRKGWKRWSNMTSGADAVSFLMKVENMTYAEAVVELNEVRLHGRINAGSSNMLVPGYHDDAQLCLPEKFEGMYRRAFAYLTQTRCIDSKIVAALIADNRIYQDKDNNVVFVGYDEQNDVKYASVRGTLTDVQYRRDCTGSDKRYCFSMPGKLNDKIYVFESPIDAMSHATLINKIVERDDAWKVHTRITLGGTSDVALKHYLSMHPEVKEINVCLDNDFAGRFESDRIKVTYEAIGYKVIQRFSKLKDFNEDLCENMRLENDEKKTIVKMRG